MSSTHELTLGTKHVVLIKDVVHSIDDTRNINWNFFILQIICSEKKSKNAFVKDDFL